MNMIKALLLQEQLSPAFEMQILPHYAELAVYLAQQHAKKNGKLLVAVNGAQGTGKSTLALFLQALLQAQGKRVAVLSIDDLYYTHQEREQLAINRHPLLKTRGVPGTHDLGLGQAVIEQLLKAQAGEYVQVPAFDKASDDRKAQTEWSSIEGPVDIIILEGWCVGATPMPTDSLVAPMNELEAGEDAQQAWRQYMNHQLSNIYQTFFRQFDCLVMLKAPSFDCIKAWRALQEEKLARKMQGLYNITQPTNNSALNAPLKGLMDIDALNRFMMHYERLTKHMLVDMPARADVLITLAEDHSIESVHYKNTVLNNG
jgi:D-glycerate 3-kinase